MPTNDLKVSRLQLVTRSSARRGLAESALAMIGVFCLARAGIGADQFAISDKPHPDVWPYWIRMAMSLLGIAIFFPVLVELVERIAMVYYMTVRTSEKKILLVGRHPTSNRFKPLTTIQK